MHFGEPPVLSVELRGDVDPPIDWDVWPANVPAVAAILQRPLPLAPGVTFLVGENGSGKSTLLEGIAMAYGLSPEGGSTGARHSTRESESPLNRWLRVRRGRGASHWGFFLRAETMHSFYTYLEDNPRLGSRQDTVFHEMSHGESFLALVDSRFDDSGFYCLDEPEAALSFESTLALMGTLHSMASDGAQILCATHSPVLASLPGATILEVGEWGLRERTWEDLAIVNHWRRYLSAPQAYLRHVLSSDSEH